MTLPAASAPFLIRRATPADFAAVGEITVRSYVEDGHLPPGSAYARVLADAGARAAGAELWVAVEESGEVLGSVTFAPPGTPYAEVSNGDEGEFRMLAVDPAHRRQGVAEALVGVCLERARELGYDGLVLSSLAVQAPAQRIYRRLGFRRDPDRDWSPVEGVDLEAFVLRFDGAAGTGAA